MWIIPTRNRADRLRVLMDQAIVSGVMQDAPVFVLVDHCEQVEQYKQVEQLAPHNWHFQYWASPIRIVPQVNSFIAELADDAWPKWFGYVTDDVDLPTDRRWEQDCIDVAMKMGGAATKDFHQPMRLHGALVLRADIIKALGYMFPPKLFHMYGDDVWETYRRELGFPVILNAYESRQRHPMNGEKGDDTHAQVQKFVVEDKPAFDEWYTNRHIDYDKVYSLIGRKSVAVDMSGISIAIVTPTIDGRVSVDYMYSMLQNAHHLDKLGIKWQHYNCTGNSLLPNARNDLLMDFWKSEHTHMLMIDSDMSWPGDTIPRLAAYKEDFIAIAAPQRTRALKFCFSLFEDGSFNHRQETGLLEVARVGTGFMLVSRECIKKLIEAYDILFVEKGTGHPFFELFKVANNLTEETAEAFGYECKVGMRISEDYTLCDMWRAIGGKVVIDPSISMKHFGRLTQTGAVADMLAQYLNPVPKAAE